MFDDIPKRLVYMGSDHAGFQSKEELKKYLESKNLQVIDLGCFTEEPCDYPDIAREVSEKVLEHHDTEALGIILCGSGIGVTIAANKLKGIRAALAINEHMAEMSRKHNNANVLALAARDTSLDDLKKITEKFLITEFEKNEERHVRRVEKLNSM